MTEELLQRIAKCAPAWMGAVFYKGRSSNTPSRVMFNNVFWQHPLCQVAEVVELFATDEPYINSQGCEAMLDAMEREGFAVWLSQRLYCEDPENDRMDVDGYECMGYRMKGDSDSFECYGPTRDVAVGEAFCQVFEGLR